MCFGRRQTDINGLPRLSTAWVSGPIACFHFSSSTPFTFDIYANPPHTPLERMLHAGGHSDRHKSLVTGDFPHWAHMLCIMSLYFCAFGCLCTSRGLPELQTEEEEQSYERISENHRKMSRPYIAATLCTSLYMCFLCFVSMSGGWV